MSPFAPGIERLLAAQERFDALRREAVPRAGRSLCDLAYANAYDRPPEAVRQALRGALEGERALDLQYTPYGGATIPRRVAARSLEASHGQRFAWRHVVLTPGATGALAAVLRVVAERGGPVVVPVPCWLDYPLYLANLGVPARLVPLSREDHHLDLDALGRALGPDTAAVLLAQPANPTGVVYGDEELAALAALLRERAPGALWISDEAHRDFVDEPARLVSPVAHHDATVVIQSLGKRLFLQGQRIGWAAVSPRAPGADALARDLERACRILGLATPTALMQRALPALLETRPDVAAVGRRRERVAAALRASGYPLAGGEATWFLYPRTPGGDDFAFAAACAERGVLVLPAPVFHDEGHFRISVTATDAMLDRALEVLAELGGRA